MTAKELDTEKSKTEHLANPTLQKIQLLKQYGKKDVSLKQVVDKIYEIDNPPPSKLIKGLIVIGMIIAAPLLSRRSSH